MRILISIEAQSVDFQKADLSLWCLVTGKTSRKQLGINAPCYICLVFITQNELQKDMVKMQ